MSRPAEFDTPYVVTKPIPYQHLSALTPDGEPDDDGVLKIGDTVWSHHFLPRVPGHRTALAFIEDAGEILIEVTALKRRNQTQALRAPKRTN